MIRPDQGAFPILHSEGKWQPGLSKREYIATHVLAGMVANSATSDSLMVDAACDAVRYADALITALNTTPKQVTATEIVQVLRDLAKIMTPDTQQMLHALTERIERQGIAP